MCKLRQRDRGAHRCVLASLLFTGTLLLCVALLLQSAEGQKSSKRTTRTPKAPIKTLAFQGKKMTKPSGNIIRAIRRASMTQDQGNGVQNSVPGFEIEVQSLRGFVVRNERWVLQIGTQEFVHNRDNGGNPFTLIFWLTEPEYAALKSGDPVRVKQGVGNAGEKYDFGLLEKRLTEEQKGR
jgi:hypothetical protein